jgi:GntR family transcriptional regulator/MocR family aminotransferase
MAVSLSAPSGPARSLLIRIDPRASEGLQEQVYFGIRRSILHGFLPPGARVPSSRELATDLGVSRTTTLLALEQLLAEGYLRTRPGSGTFVADELPDELPRSRPSPVRPGPVLPVSSHPPLSRRGALLSSLPAAARRVAGPPRPFRIGVPALDLFPFRTWSQLASRRLRSVTASQLDYGSPAGLPALREAIAEHVTSARGARCTADQVLVVAGAQRGVDFASHLLLDHGDPAWVEDPGYPGAWKALTAAGARMIPVPVDAEGLDVTAGRERAPAARLAYVSPSHQFPLGVAMSLPRRLALLEWASQAQAWVIEDDYDSEFRYGAPPMPCLQGLDPEGRVVYVGSYAKTLFPSLRLGFLIVPLGLSERFRAARRGGDLHPPALDQAVLADFMERGHFARHLRRMRSVYRERWEALQDAAVRHGGGALRVRPARTGLHLVADLEVADASRVFEEATARGVEVMPLCAYSREQAPINGLVLGFGSVRPERLDRGMELLVAAIEAASHP